MKTLILTLVTIVSLISCNSNNTKNEDVKFRFYNKNTGVEYTFLTSDKAQKDIKNGLVVKVDMTDCTQSTFLGNDYSENLPKYNK